jgi:hypothetical protein
MMYLVAIVIPPLALVLTGRIFHAVISAVLWGLSILIFVFSLGFGGFISGPLWIIAVIHAVYLVHKSRTETRMREIVREELDE